MSEFSLTVPAARAAAALATCDLNGNRDDLATLMVDLTDPRDPRHTDAKEITVAAAELTGRAWTVLAVVAGREPIDFAATIAGNYRARTGTESKELLVCYAAAMQVARRVDLEAASLTRLIMQYGPVTSSITAARVLGAAWQLQARAQGCTAVEIGQRYTLAFSAS